jgi:macrolide-specific efflux system membrane fusion protein
LTPDGPSPKQEAFFGQVVFVSPEIDPVNGQVRVLIEIDNPELTLRPGTRATAVITPEER